MLEWEELISRPTTRERRSTYCFIHGETGFNSLEEGRAARRSVRRFRFVESNVARREYTD